jgi:hypothetical protein
MPDRTIAITRATDRFGKPWLLEQVAGPGGATDIWMQGLGWNQGKPEAYWSMDPEGLVLRAVGTNDPLDVPLLVIPATVKRGMKWVVRGDDGESLLTGEIAGGDHRDTEWGRRRVWKVEIEVAERQPYEGSLYSTPQNRSPLEWTQEFVEGRGLTNTTQAIIPLEDQEQILPQRVAMDPLPELTKRFRGRVHGFSVTQDKATGHMEPQLGMRIPGVVPTTLFKILANGKSMSVTEYFFDRKICYRTDGASVSEINPDIWELDPAKEWDSGPCQDANGVVYADDGSFAAYAPFHIDGLTPSDWFFDFGPGIQIMGYNAMGSFKSDRPYWGAAMGFTRDGGILAGGIMLLNPEYAEGDPRPAWKKMQNPSSGGFLFRLGPWTQQWGLDHIDRVIGLTPQTDAGVDALYMGNGVLGHGLLTTQGSPKVWSPTEWWRVAHTGLALHTYDEFVVVTYNDNHREVYQVSEDGLVWHVDMVGEMLKRTFLVAVQVPAGQQVVGVVPVGGGDLQVWTQEGFVWEGTEDVIGVGMVDIYTDDIWQHVWNVKLPTAGAAEPPPLAGELFMQASGADVLVCAPMGNVLPTDGWMLGGQEPFVVDVDKRCILLVRPLPEYLDGPPQLEEAGLVPTDPTEWLVQATLPDVGPVEMRLTPVQPLIPTDLRAVGSGDILGGIAGQTGLEQSGLVRLTGPGKALIEHFWGPSELTRCSKYAWEMHIWDEASMPEMCNPPSSCQGLMRIGAQPGDYKPFFLPEGTLVPGRNFEEWPETMLLPDGCLGVFWAGWYYRLDDEMGPVEIPNPFLTPTAEWARCSIMEIDHNPLNPDVDRYSCELADGTSKQVELPVGMEKRFVPLEAESLTFVAPPSTLPQLWRLDQGTWDSMPVTVPRPEHFGGRGIAGLDGYCGADGACYLLLVGVAGKNGEAVPWQILRADRQGSGLHPVYAGWSTQSPLPEHVAGDDQFLMVTGAGQIVWRGFRDMEPTSCQECSGQEECLSGFCVCEFGQVRRDGFCESDIPAATYRTCAEALNAGVAEGTPVRIDGDGPDWPAPQFVTVCGAPGEWTEVPPEFLMTSGMGTVNLHNHCTRLGATDFMWGAPVALVGITAEGSLHGEFELNLDLGVPFVMDEQSYNPETMFVLDDVSLFTTESGWYTKGCDGTDDNGAYGNEIRVTYSAPDVLEIDTDGASFFKGTWTQGVPMRIAREADGFVRIYAGEMLYWTSDRAYGNDFRLFKLDHGGARLVGARFKGSAGAFCTPRCDGRVCGDDQCGGTCGACIEHAHCTTDGVCACDEPRFFTYYEDECLWPIGSGEYPAASCKEAMEARVPWASDPWIDPDGEGGEAPFQMHECGSFSVGPTPGGYWTRSPAYFLGDQAVMVFDSVGGTCSSFASFQPAFATPISSLGANAHLLGSAVPAGVIAAATNRFVKGAFSLDFSLYVGDGGQAAGVGLDGLASFDSVDAAWVGWKPACGETVDTSKRLWLSASSEGIWVGVGNAPPELLGPSSYGFVNLTRRETGEIEVHLADQLVAHTVPTGMLPDSLRIVASVEGGGNSKVVVSNVYWK